MREPFSQLYVHLVWATWDRLPLLTSDIRPQVFAAMAVKCRALRCAPLAIGGIDNHVHMLVKFPATVRICDLVQEMKGSSSHLVTNVLRPKQFFKWQGAYAAFTIHDRDVERVKQYILHQEQHHADQSFDMAWEESLMTQAVEDAEVQGE